MGLLIHDGYTFSHKIEAAGRLPALAYSYRPAMPTAIHEYLAALRIGGKAADEATVAALQKHLVKWDLQEDRPGRVAGVAAIDAATLAALPYDYRERMIAKIMAYDGTEREADEKNSGTGPS